MATTGDAAAAEPLPSPPASAGDLATRLREMALAANASASSPEEMIEAARAAAQAAADAAVAARAVAAEKAAVAAKARAAARAAMEFLDSFSSRGAGASRNGNGLQFKVKSRKKHVQVKMLYRPNGTLGLGEAPKPRRRKQSDEEVARNLHRVMNSSPRISHTGPPKRPRTITAGDAKDAVVAPGGGNGEGDTDACNGSSIHVPIEAGTGLPNGCSEGKSSERTVPLLNREGPDVDGQDSSRHAAKSSGDIADNGVWVRNLSAGQKVKIKRKELLLNQNGGKETEEPKESEQPRETEPFVHSFALDESKSNSNGKGRSKPNGNGAEKLAGPADTKTPGDGVTPMKITSVWKFKKLKTSHCSSDSKVLHKVCPPPPAAAETSASVKAD